MGLFGLFGGGNKPPQGGGGNPEMPSGNGSMGGMLPEAKPAMPATATEIPSINSSTPSTSAGSENLPNTAPVMPGSTTESTTPSADTAQQPEGSSMLGSITGSNMNSTETPNQMVQERDAAKAAVAETPASTAAPENPTIPLETTTVADSSMDGTPTVEATSANVGETPAVEDAAGKMTEEADSAMTAVAPEVQPVAVATTTSPDLSAAAGMVVNATVEGQAPSAIETHIDTTDASSNSDEAVEQHKVESPMTIATSLAEKPIDENQNGQIAETPTVTAPMETTAAVNSIPSPDTQTPVTGQASDSSIGGTALGREQAFDAAAKAWNNTEPKQDEVVDASATNTPPVETDPAAVDNAPVGVVNESSLPPATAKPAGAPEPTVTMESQGGNILDQVESHVNSLSDESSSTTPDALSSVHQEAADVVNAIPEAPHLDTSPEPTAVVPPTPEPAMVGAGASTEATPNPWTSQTETPPAAVQPAMGGAPMPPMAGAESQPAGQPVNSGSSTVGQ